jgi:hypothetical protein
MIHLLKELSNYFVLQIKLDKLMICIGE